MNARSVYAIFDGGQLETNAASDARLVKPVVYLIDNVKIDHGSGTPNNPFVLFLSN